MKVVLVLFCGILLFTCKTHQQQNVADLFKADRRFSETAVKTGFNKAFIEYAHPDAVLLRKNRMPIVGKQSIAGIYENLDTTGIRFSWEPLSGDIAKSGELGYTYGIYTVRQDTLIEKGTYVSIWKKDKNGDWKYVLDTGNEGLGK